MIINIEQYKNEIYEEFFMFVPEMLAFITCLKKSIISYKSKIINNYVLTIIFFLEYKPEILVIFLVFQFIRL